MKKISLYFSLLVAGLLMTACNEEFDDWSKPQSFNEDGAIEIPGYTASAATSATIDLNSAEDIIKVINMNGEALPDGYKLATLRMNVVPLDEENAKTTDVIKINAVDAEGNFSMQDLQDAIVTFYGPRPVSRKISAHVYVDADKDGQSSLIDAGVIELDITPKAPYIATEYFLIGGPNDWQQSAAERPIKFTHSGKDVYEDPVFTVVFPASEGDTWFAFGDKEACEAIPGDWTKLFGTMGDSKDTKGSFDYRYNLGGDHSFCVPAGVKFIKLTVDMLDRTYKIEAVNISTEYYLIGGPNDWEKSAAERPIKFTHSDKNVVDDPVFTCVFPAADFGTWFAFGDLEACEAIVNDKDWSKLYAYKGDECGLSGQFDTRAAIADGDRAFSVTQTCKLIRFEVNMMTMEYTITPLNFNEYIYTIGMIGQTSWNKVFPMRSPNFDGKYLGYYYVAGEFKFKPNADNWEGDWGQKKGASKGTLVQDDEENCSADGNGFYQFNVDLGAMTYSLSPVTSISIIGTVNGNWDTDTDLTYNVETGAWETTAALSAGLMKFRMNHDWAISWGGNGSSTAYDNLTQYNGDNLEVTEAATYKVQLFLSCEGNHKVVLTKQ